MKSTMPSLIKGKEINKLGTCFVNIFKMMVYPVYPQDIKQQSYNLQ